MVNSIQYIWLNLITKAIGPHVFKTRKSLSRKPYSMVAHTYAGDDGLEKIRCNYKNCNDKYRAVKMLADVQSSELQTFHLTGVCVMDKLTDEPTEKFP